MRLCENCNKEYNQSLKFCPACGSELVETTDYSTEKDTGSTYVDIEFNEDLMSGQNVENDTNEKKCINCGSVIVDGEKFCINCGSKTNETSVLNGDEKTGTTNQYQPNNKELLQNCSFDVFQSNKFFAFFLKYAAIFALYYPIYLVMSSISGQSGLVGILENISIFAFYAYYIGLFALWSKKDYLTMLIAFAIRFLNSFIRLFQPEVPVSSICRIIVLVAAFILVFKEFRATGQYKNIESRFKINCCPSCGVSVKSNDKFCPKCGRKMEG